MRAAINRENFVLPASIDFIAAFGCDVNFDRQTHTEEYVFEDELSDISRMWIGSVDRTFSLSMTKNGTEVVRVFDECVSCVRLDETRKVVVITLGDGAFTQELTLSVWPRGRVSFTRMR
ncbi:MULTISPECIES: hypothetical protein [Halomonas]|uniref:hypothetical protein n=1 Tax=Halomonas TaxID=2745 RepID=UPI001C97BB77|nr:MULTISPECIES: hypothetical protein [Halomonas]MBY5925752.1 hypothetical protein [Halomonas sp. DP4Y7-2]MBY5969579.1 hypothetical protein [Halomonas denitrificans]MBY6232794.1 hypothetical protein [Halomonas sp. DP4Y7-1]